MYPLIYTSLTTIAKFCIERETRIGNAIKSYQERDKAKVAALAREFNILYHLLRGRILGTGPPTGSGKVLNPVQENEVDQWMVSLETAFTPATLGMVEDEANRILARDGIEVQVGRNWPLRFIARRPSQRPDLQRLLRTPNNSAPNREQPEAAKAEEVAPSDVQGHEMPPRKRARNPVSRRVSEPETKALDED
ncbi:hypothetical protein N7447_001222 [Penicillium robsamsonii]|uniref:uncharacterized protein n=1 Tax=Penicillium robsamsonii TaxID=1792511 RepID=UPI002547BE3F|nr:uncharacterized protein N7447_001222 [Penicillium robsamsonii]KAJ5835196.1 hypothetical protein N7447_001222 [Penicillium robsamsonii]